MAFQLKLLLFQNVHRDLQESLDDQEVLKGQIAEYASQVARIEDLLAQKVGLPSECKSFAHFIITRRIIIMF